MADPYLKRHADENTKSDNIKRDVVYGSIIGAGAVGTVVRRPTALASGLGVGGGAGAVAGAASPHKGTNRAKIQQAARVSRQRNYQRRSLSKMMTTSVWGVDHGVSKAMAGTLGALARGSSVPSKSLRPKRMTFYPHPDTKRPYKPKYPSTFVQTGKDGGVAKAAGNILRLGGMPKIRPKAAKLAAGFDNSAALGNITKPRAKGIKRVAAAARNKAYDIAGAAELAGRGVRLKAIEASKVAGSRASAPTAAATSRVKAATASATAGAKASGTKAKDWTKTTAKKKSVRIGAGVAGGTAVVGGLAYASPHDKLAGRSGYRYNPYD